MPSRFDENQQPNFLPDRTVEQGVTWLLVAIGAALFFGLAIAGLSKVQDATASIADDPGQEAIEHPADIGGNHAVRDDAAP